MAHFAQLDENNIVTKVIVVSNDELIDENGIESEVKGIAFCRSLFGEETRWVQTSYNGNFRGVYAAIGFGYDANLDLFKEPPLPLEVSEAITFQNERIGKIPNDVTEEIP
jgi:hypothetical protein